MPKWDSTEAPVSVTVDDPEAYTGDVDERPVKVSVDGTNRHVAYRGDREAPDVQASMSPAEAYHFADDLQAAADACWNGTEYLVTVVTGHDKRNGPMEEPLTTVKAPDPETAVRRAKELVAEMAEFEGASTMVVRHQLARENDEFRTYRADSMNTVRTDDADDN